MGEVIAWQMGAATSAPSLPKIKIRKDREKIEVGLGAHSPFVVVRRVRYRPGAKR